MKKNLLKKILLGLSLFTFAFTLNVVFDDKSDTSSIETMNTQAAHAGNRKKASKKNKENCEKWCKQQHRCEKCSTKRGCGAGYVQIKTWGGKGRNWHACSLTKFSEYSKANKSNCKKWCAENKDCKFCSAFANCQGSGSRIKKFGHEGANWHACK